MTAPSSEAERRTVTGGTYRPEDGTAWEEGASVSTTYRRLEIGDEFPAMSTARKRSLALSRRVMGDVYRED